jgi:hypothetical protein
VQVELTGEVETMASNESTAAKQGISPGTEEGPVKSANVWQADCVRYDGDGVKLNIDVASGDSGGPIWEYQGEGDVHIITQTNEAYDSTNSTECGNTVYNTTFGFATYKILNSNGYSI